MWPVDLTEAKIEEIYHPDKIVNFFRNASRIAF